MNPENETEAVEIELNTVLEHPIRRRLRRMWSAKQLFESLRPLFRVTFLYGLTSFYVGYNNETCARYIKKTWLGYVNGIAHIALYSICYILTICNKCESVASYFFRSEITEIGDLMQIVNGYIGVTVIYITAIIPKHRLEQCLHTFHAMDVQLQSIGIKIMYTTMLRYSYVMMISMFVINLSFTWGTFAVLHTSHKAPSLALHFTFMIQHSVIAIAIAMFSCFAHLVETRLVMVNRVSIDHYQVMQVSL